MVWQKITNWQKTLECIIRDGTRAKRFYNYSPDDPELGNALSSYNLAAGYEGGTGFLNPIVHMVKLRNAVKRSKSDISLKTCAADRFGEEFLFRVHDILRFMENQAYYNKQDEQNYLNSVAVNADFHEGIFDTIQLQDETEKIWWDPSEQNLETYTFHLGKLKDFMVELNKTVPNQNTRRDLFYALNGRGEFWLPGVLNTRLYQNCSALNATPFTDWIRYFSDKEKPSRLDNIDFAKMEEFNRKIVDLYKQERTPEQQLHFEELLSLFSYHFISGEFEGLNSLVWGDAKDFDYAWDLNSLMSAYYDLLYFDGYCEECNRNDMQYSQEIRGSEFVPKMMDFFIRDKDTVDAISSGDMVLDMVYPYSDIKSTVNGAMNDFIQNTVYSIITNEELSMVDRSLVGNNDAELDTGLFYLVHDTLEEMNIAESPIFSSTNKRLQFVEKLIRKITLFKELSPNRAVLPEQAALITLYELGFPESFYGPESKKNVKARTFFDSINEHMKNVEIEYDKHMAFIDEILEEIIKKSAPIPGDFDASYVLQKPVSITFDKFYGLDKKSSMLYRAATFTNDDYWLLKAQNYLFGQISEICPKTSSKIDKAVFVTMGGGTLDEELELIYSYLSKNPEVTDVVIYNVEKSNDMINWTKKRKEINDAAEKRKSIKQNVNFNVFQIEENFLGKDFNLVKELEIAAQGNSESLSDSSKFEMYVLALTNMPGNLPEDDGQKLLIQRMADAAHLYGGKVVVGLAMEGDPTDYGHPLNERASRRPLDVLGIPRRVFEYKPSYNDENKRWEFNFESRHNYSKVFFKDEKQIEVIFPKEYKFTVEPFSRRYTIETEPGHENYFYAGDLLGTDFVTTTYDDFETDGDAATLTLDARLLTRTKQSVTMNYSDWKPYTCERGHLRETYEDGENIDQMHNSHMPDSTPAYALFTYDFAPKELA
ncbi:MAG: hypothetical protein KKF44_01430, partial [Nanoarchaeota archaeon]|nr:hypothetical protein [Nanoarchaeota archaeon]